MRPRQGNIREQSKAFFVFFGTTGPCPQLPHTTQFKIENSTTFRPIAILKASSINIPHHGTQYTQQQHPCCISFAATELKLKYTSCYSSALYLFSVFIHVRNHIRVCTADHSTKAPLSTHQTSKSGARHRDLAYCRD